MQVKEIVQLLDTLAPRIYQESYDNSGFLVGNLNTELTGVLCTLDCTESVVEEAIQTNCNLIVAHHPIIFKGLKKIVGSNYIERTVIKAIQNNICIYASHTNLDNIKGGVNFKIADQLGLKDVKILAPKKEQLKKLTVFVPESASDGLLESLHQAGAGNIGNYQNCSFQSTGTGSFKPNDLANPSIGSANKLEKVTEVKIEVIVPVDREFEILVALKKNHPYEEVAYYLTKLENEHQEIGSGAIGLMDSKMNVTAFLGLIKKRFELRAFKYSNIISDAKKNLKVAVCGGVGSFLIPDAIRAEADIFITSDLKYHEYFDAENKIVLVDIGHFESEVFTKELFGENISKKFPNIAVLLSKTNTNPVQYYL